jgi:glutamine synthetase
MSRPTFNPVETSKEHLGLIEKLRAQGVDVVRVQYSDIHGVARGKDVPLAAFPRVMADGLAFCAANLADGLNFSLANLAERVAASPRSEPRPDVKARPGEEIDSSPTVVFPDMRVKVIPATLVHLPWEPSTAWCLATVDDDDAQSACSSRNLLERVVSQYHGIGLETASAPELEFYLLRRDAQGQLRRYTDDLSMIYTTGTRSDPEGVVLEMLRYGRQIGLDVVASHHECGRGQYEINLNHGESLDAADRCFRFKLMVKEIAARHNLLATFMGKPFSDDAGSGFHLHVSLNGDASNRFYDPQAQDGLSDLARNFLAGVLEHASALTAFYSPTVNSYKRFVPGTLVPTAVNWGYDNRTTFLRVPNERGPATRVEIRAADAAANPYLVAAVSLLAGLDGIRRKLVPPEPLRRDASAGDSIGKPLPRSLEDSLKALQADACLVEAIGQPLVSAFCSAKAVEAERFRLHITEWEINEYAWHL